VNENVLHWEVQYIRQKFILILVLITAFIPVLVFVIGIIIQIGFNIPFGDDHISDTTLILSGMFSIIIASLIIILFKFSNMTIEVRRNGFFYKYFPFHLSVKSILPQDIKSFYIRKFSALGEFGGWGIRYGFGKRGKGYVVSGNMGVQFIMQNDKKVLFSTVNPDKMQSALEKVFTMKTNFEGNI
jgi:hypothetical protein